MIQKELFTTIPDCQNIKTQYDKWHHFLENKVVFSHASSQIHTKDHCARVLLYALVIANQLGLSEKDKDALGAAAAFHDSRRQDDWLDVGHGQRAADAYRDFCHLNSLPFDERAYFAMAFHDQNDEIGISEIERRKLLNGVLLYQIFKDSDGLDRFRLGPNALDVDMLRTEESKELVELAKELNIKIQKIDS